jgi:Effector Associated Constant Component 1
MLAEITVLGGDDVTEITELWEWLRGERRLAGAVEPVRRSPGESELGGTIELLTVALGSGGAGVVLARSLAVWLRTRRSDVSVVVRTKTGSATVTATNLDEDQVLPLLEQVLRERHD